jgi:hypothetical protein
MLRQNPHMLLMDTLGFSATELETNRRGELSAEQKSELQFALTRQIGLWTMIVFVMWLIGLAAQVNILMMLFVTAVIGSLLIGLWRQLRDDLTEKMGVATGRVEIHGHPLFPGIFARVQVNDDTFRVSHAVGMAFVPGRIYRLYYAPDSRTLLSAELLS